MIFREAIPQDIPQIQIVRNSVRENQLSNPDLVSNQDCLDYICERGKGWVCEIAGRVVGFAIADLVDENIWALFVHPEHEQKGIGTKLQQQMLEWYFSTAKTFVWLGTEAGTRAEAFYRQSGWVDTGFNGPGEIRFEMTRERFLNRQ